MMTKKILFVCKFNRFRSRVAERYLKKINPELEVKSAGLIRGRPLDKNQIKLAKSEGIDITGSPQGLSSELLDWQDVIIIVADDVPREVFDHRKFKRKTILWDIEDADSDDTEGVIKIIKSIKSKVNEFNEELKNENRKSQGI